MYKPFLIEFFKILNITNANYLILRGYQGLPEKVSYDLDFAVKNEAELLPFFKILHDLSKKYEYFITRDVVRQGLLKVYLHFGNEILKIDVFCFFGYAGLEYMDTKKLFESKRKLKSDIWVPGLNYELSLSLLKEILHNSRIRKDKVNLLREQFNQETFKDPFLTYFSENNIKKLSNSLLMENKLVFKKLSLSFRIELINSNVKHHGLLKTISSMFDFLWIKYVNDKRYDSYIYGSSN